MVLRTRLALALISFVVIGLELALMRILSLGFWYYFASMVISVGLLGFGFSGTILTLVQDRLRHRPSLWLTVLSFSSSLSLFFSVRAMQDIPLDMHYLAWNLQAEWFHILEIELLMLLPFVLTGGFLGLVLMDRPERIPGHYSANLAGSGAGALLSLGIMFYLSAAGLLILLSFLCYAAGLLMTRWKNPKSVAACIGVCMLWLAAAGFFPPEVRISPYKKAISHIPP